jgi:hypothetical protein
MTASATTGLSNAQLVIGGYQNLETMRHVADQATEQLDVDLFSGKSPWFEHIARERPDVDTLFLADPETKKSIRKMVRRNGGTYVTVGAAPAKNHAKSVVANASDAAISTAAFAPMTPYRYEVGVRFTGEPAAAMAEVTRARASRDPERIVASAARARSQGILINDPAYGVWHLSEDVTDLVRSARHRLIIASKRVEEPGIINDIRTAHASGVPVAVSKYRKKYPLHANIVIADDRAYIGSGHLTKRVLTGGGTNGRISRELGVMIDDPATVDYLARSLAANKFIRLDKHGVPTGMPLLWKVGIGAGVIGALGGALYLANRFGSSGPGSASTGGSGSGDTPSAPQLPRITLGDGHSLPAHCSGRPPAWPCDHRSFVVPWRQGRIDRDGRSMCGMGGIGGGALPANANVRALGEQLQRGLQQLQGGGPIVPARQSLPPGVSPIPAPPEAMKPVAAPAGAPTTDAKGGKLHYFNHPGDPTPRAYDQATVNFFFLPGNTNNLGRPGAPTSALNAQLSEGLRQLQAMGLNVQGGGAPGKFPGQVPPMKFPGPPTSFPGFLHPPALPGGCGGGPMTLPPLPESMKRYDAQGHLIIPPGFGPPAPPAR